MSEIDDKLSLVMQARDNIKNSLINKGQAVGNDIRTYADAINNIPTGGGSGDVKLFSTIEEMSTAEGNEGDLAIVYTPVKLPMKYEDRFNIVEFPETVYIEELAGFSDYMMDCSGTFGYDNFEETRSSKGDISLSLSQEYDWETDKYIGYSGSVYIYISAGAPVTVRYVCDSDDSSIWRRTTFTKTNPVLLDDYIHMGSEKGPWGWHDFLGNFFILPTKQFNGLYEFKNNKWELAESNLDAEAYNVAFGKFYGKNGTEDGTLQNKVNISSLDELKTKIYIYQNLSNLDLESDFIDLSSLLYSIDTINTLPYIDMSNVTNTAYMCYNCINLIDVPEFNSTNIVNMYQMFNNCNNLSVISYHNIANSLPLAENLSNHYISSIGLNINKFSQEDKILLGQKGYVEAIPYVVNISNVSKYWNISY